MSVEYEVLLMWPFVNGFIWFGPCVGFFRNELSARGDNVGLDLLRKLQLDSNNSAVCGSKGNLRNILELICNKPVAFNLRLDHGLNEDV